MKNSTFSANIFYKLYAVDIGIVDVVCDLSSSAIVDDL